jgi:anti-sigma B factor antagonist
MQDFRLTTRQLGEVSIVDLSGKITSGVALTAFRDAIRDEVAKGHDKIVLNLKDVSYIDSSGLGELVLALGTVTQTICGSCGATLFKDDDSRWESCAQCNSNDRKFWGQLKLAHPGRQVTDLLQFTKLNTVFDVHQTESDALSSFYI